MRALRTVSASTLIAQVQWAAQGQMSQEAVEIFGGQRKVWGAYGEHESQKPRSSEA